MARAVLMLFLILLPALAQTLVSQGRLQGPVQVLRVVDGDTVELAGVGTVRLIGIDAPESTYNHRTSGPEEVRLGLEAKAFLQVNLELVRAGWAEPYTVPPNVRYADLYLEAAREARAKGRGIWSP